METERLYKVTLSEIYAFWGGSSGYCNIADVIVKSDSAEAAGKKAIEVANKKIKAGDLQVTSIRCLGFIELGNE